MLGFIVNCGSSSIKTRLIDTDTKETLFDARAEHLGTESATIKTNADFRSHTLNNCSEKTYKEILDYILNDMIERCIVSNLNEISFVGHRIVHGGDFFSEPTIITEEVIEKITLCNELAPLHNPVGILGIRCCEQLLPSAIHVAVFDTAFHQTIPEINFRYAIPDLYYNSGIRKYGFHGTSYSYLTRILGEKVEKKNISAVMAHIGQGTSVCAVNEGKSVYNSMEFSPLSGCIMGTRSGNVDPTVIQYLCNKFDYSVDQVLSILNKESGLLALSKTNNMLKILDGVKNNDECCIFTLDFFCYSIVSSMAQAIITLGKKPKQIVFTGGIGENSSIVREKILEKLVPFIGEVDYNTVPNYSVSINRFFSSFKKKNDVTVYVIKTNEELEIALEAAKLLS